MDIVLIGSGHVAHHLGQILHKHDHRIVQVYNRTLSHARALADILSSVAINDPKRIDLDADLYIMAVSDHALPLIIDQLPSALQGIVVHTSGATALSVLDKFGKSGVIYPPQSLTKEVDTDMSKIPFGIEANDTNTLDTLIKLLHPISPLTFHCTSQQRLALHIAAVFANNFSNSLFQIAHDLLQQENLSFDLIRPIILETAQKVQNHLPKDMQTGPAVRNDQGTITRHLEYLKQDSDWQSIYQLISVYISKK